jgi:hypothetical protein
MGGGASKDEALQLAYTRVQASVDARVRYVREMRAVIASGVPVDVEDAKKPASGERSKVRRTCVVRSRDGTYECEYVAALKCGDDETGAFTFDTAVASLLSRLVAAHVSPHFTLLIHANASSSASAAAAPRRGRDRDRDRDRDRSRCALLELNETTLFEFLETTPQLPSAVVYGITFQIAHAMLAAFVAFGVSHNDLHRQNIMGVRVPPDTVYEYDVFGTTYRVPLHGWLWKLIDFDKADVGASHSHAKHTFEAGRKTKLMQVAGPAMDVAAAAPKQVQGRIEKTVAKYMEARGIASPAVQIGALCEVLHICYTEIYKADGAGAGIPADFCFSLNNDASQAAATFDDGLALQFASAKSYYLVRPEILSDRAIKRTLHEFGEAKSLPAVVPRDIPRLQLAPLPRRHDAEPARKRQCGAGADICVDLTLSDSE